MGTLLPPEALWIAAPLAGCWTALMCLKALGADLEYQRKVRTLTDEANQLRREHEQRRQRLYESTMNRTRSRFIGSGPGGTGSVAGADAIAGSIAPSPAAPPPLAQAA